MIIHNFLEDQHEFTELNKQIPQNITNVKPKQNKTKQQ